MTNMWSDMEAEFQIVQSRRKRVQSKRNSVQDKETSDEENVGDREKKGKEGRKVNHAASIQPGSAAAKEHERGNGRTERETHRSESGEARTIASPTNRERL